MDSKFDKVITIKDDRGDISAVIIHDVESHTKKFYQTKEMGMEEILNLLNPNGNISQVGKPTNK